MVIRGISTQNASKVSFLFAITFTPGLLSRMYSSHQKSDEIPLLISNHNLHRGGITRFLSKAKNRPVR